MAATLGFNYFEGIELDVQMSSDGQIWLYHDSKLKLELDTSLCIPKMSTSEIVELNNSLSRNQQLVQLDSVFLYHSINNLNKHISIDVKGYFDSFCFENKNATQQYQFAIAEELVRLINKYNLHKSVMVETDYCDVLDRVKILDSKIDCYLLAYSNWEVACQKVLDKKYQGISYSFNDSTLTKPVILKARSMGIKTQLWTPNQESDIERALALNPNFIQTDNQNAIQLSNSFKSRLKKSSP